MRILITFTHKPFFLFILLISQQHAFSSGTMSEKEMNNVNRVDVVSEEDKKRLSIAAGLLADYEIAAKKLIANLQLDTTNAEDINNKAQELLLLSEEVITSAQFRLPQCNKYLEKTLELKTNLHKVSNETLEKDYHHDGALPKAPSECYHTKDLFVHPATVIVLTRDDPSLTNITKSAINAEITEVLGHTELVRRLVIY